MSAWYTETGEVWMDTSEYMACGRPTPPVWGLNPSGPFFVIGSHQETHGPFFRHGRLESAVKCWAENWLPEQRRSTSFILDGRGFIVVGVWWSSTVEPRWFGCGLGWSEVRKQAPKIRNLSHFAGPEGEMRLALIESSCKGEFDDLLELA